MKSAKLFGMRIPFWTKAQEKKAQRERENKEKRIAAIAAQLKAEDRYWKAIARRLEMDKKIGFPTINFPGDDHE